MAYALIVPPELLADLVTIRSATGMSIRKQILNATRAWIKERKQESSAANALAANREPKA